jgi:hypothetical protein
MFHTIQQKLAQANSHERNSMSKKSQFAITALLIERNTVRTVLAAEGKGTPL